MIAFNLSIDATIYIRSHKEMSYNENLERDNREEPE